MDTDCVKPINESGRRERRFAIRYPFAAEAEILELKSGTRLSGVTSDLSLGGCFVCTPRPFEVGTRVHLTLKYKNQSAIMLAAVRVLKPRIGMGLQSVGDDSLFARCEHHILWRPKRLFQFVVAKTSSHTDSSDPCLS